ncbi:MFS transporter [Akkermansiaceae bacterium]|nr:MFS transporter [Akkermansiaceae bacterium]
MRRARSKLPLFVFEALGSLACGFYGNYVFFLFRDRHGFGDKGNLAIAALMGLVIALASWQGGRFAQCRGYLRTMSYGLFGMILALSAGACFPQLPVQLAVLVFWTASQFLVWPALEALVTEGESGTGRAHLVGVYSVVWASCSALSYFFGGGLFEKLGSGSIFWLPPAIHVLQIAVLWGISRSLGKTPATEPIQPQPKPGLPAAGKCLCPRSFQRMAWIANPFACIAAFTLLAMIPGLARTLGLSTTMAGFFCSIWFFARLLAFVVMWRWPGWHYRFRWLLAGYVLLIAGFATVLTADGLLWLGLGQVAFGLAVGSLYYASLFYSMDVGEARAEQGGIHEAMMGAGNFVGPGVGALSLMIAPQFPDAGVLSVSGLLALGMALLLGTRLKARVSNSPAIIPAHEK